MKFGAGAPSANFEDRTGWNARQKRLHAIATLFNPVYAIRNAHDWMQANGWSPINGIDLRRNRPLNRF